jgi:hypothetical protein
MRRAGEPAACRIPCGAGSVGAVRWLSRASANVHHGEEGDYAEWAREVPTSPTRKNAQVGAESLLSRAQATRAV